MAAVVLLAGARAAIDVVYEPPWGFHPSAIRPAAVAMCALADRAVQARATGDDTAALSDPEAWRRSGTKQNGSWWEDWTTWSESRAGELIKPPHMGSRKHPAIADAPGEYVFG